MTEAGWTSKRPTKEGVYWFRWGKDRDAIIVLVLIEYGDWRVMEMGHQHSGALAGYVTGEFLGPITPDSYQQGRVAGLQEAGDLHEQVNTYCDHEPKAGAGGMGVAIRYRDLIRQQATKLAQQAQDEKGVMDAEN